MKEVKSPADVSRLAAEGPMYRVSLQPLVSAEPINCLFAPLYHFLFVENSVHADVPLFH